MSIRTKLIVAVVASMVGLAFVSGALIRTAGERNARSATEQAIASAGQAFASSETADVEKLDATLLTLSVNPALVDAFAARDRKRLLTLAAPVFESLRREHNVTHLYFIEPEPSRTCFLRVHQPDLFGDVVERPTLSKAILTRGLGAGKELGKTAFALRAVRPWFAPDGKHIGYLELGEEIDQFLGRIKGQTGDDYILLVDKAFLDEKEWAATRHGKRNNWGDRPRTVVVDATVAEDSMGELERDLASIPDRGLLLDEDVKDGKTFARGILPVKDAVGRRVGGLVVLHDITALDAAMLSARRWIYLLLLGVAIGLSLMIHLLVNRLVFRRLDGMVGTIEDLSARLAGGEYDIAAPRASGQDEIGKFEEFFGRFLRVVSGLLKELSRRQTSDGGLRSKADGG